MRFLFILTGVLFFAFNALASPNLDNYQDIEGVRLYTDHLKSNLFYLAPSPPVLGTGVDNLPGFSLEIYRYLGRKGTGDSGKFWVKGILNIDIQRERGKKVLKQIKKKLSKKYRIKNPRLRSMPVAKTDGRLLFADKNIKWSQGSRWSGKKITLPLDSIMSEILWDAVTAGQTLISVEMAESLSGVRKNSDDKWEDALVPFSFTLPVELDMAAYPSLFSKTDIGGRMVRGYTGIDIFCFDFLEQLDESLYSKVVEVAIPTPKQPLVESVTFRKNGDCRTRIQFKLAKDLDAGYKVRITRIFLDGRSKTGPWVMRMGEAMLDVTDYKDETADPETEE
jgi:hypothetical protein